MRGFLIGVLLILIVVACTGCTPMQRRVASVTAGVLVIGVIAAHQVDHGANDEFRRTPAVNCANGSCQ